MIFSFMQNGRKSKTISKLKAKKKYYIRIRTYKKLKGKKGLSAGRVQSVALKLI